MVYEVFWVLSDNLRIMNQLKIKGDKISLPRNRNTESLLNSGMISDVKPKVIYNKKESIEIVEIKPPPTQVEEKPKRRRKRNGRKSTDRASELRDTTPPVSEGLPGTEQAD